MLKKRILTAVAISVAMAFSFTSTANSEGKGPHPRPVIYVTGQDLYFDSIIVADPVPPFGPFQLLEMGPNGLQTEFGKGDRGYFGGRWKEDFDDDGVFHYFVCPLLGKGRPTP